MSKEVELKNCPCCDSKAKIRDNFGIPSPTCTVCGLSIRSNMYLDIDEALELSTETWNTRHQDSVLEELQIAQERIEILESENQQLKMEFNSVLEENQKLLLDVQKLSKENHQLRIKDERVIRIEQPHFNGGTMLMTLDTTEEIIQSELRKLGWLPPSVLEEIERDIKELLGSVGQSPFPDDFDDGYNAGYRNACEEVKVILAKLKTTPPKGAGE